MNLKHDPCENCGAPGYPVTIVRAGKVVWNHVLCEVCFQVQRAYWQKQHGLSVSKVGDA